MPLTTEERVELMKRARLAKANKKLADAPVVNVEPPVEQPPTPKVKKSRKKNEIAPLPVPVQVIQEEESEEEAEEVIEVPVPVPKKKALPAKWLKQIKTEPERVCCNEKLTKEKPVIDDVPQVVAETIVVPSKKEIKKPRQPRASAPTRTLELTEPTPIEDVIEDLKRDNQKYLPKIKQAPLPTPPQQPIQIVRAEPALRLFDY